MCLPYECLADDVKSIFVHAVNIFPNDFEMPFNMSQLLNGKYRVRCQEEKPFDAFSISAM